MMRFTVLFCFLLFLFLLNTSIFFGVTSYGYEINTHENRSGKILWMFKAPWGDLHDGIWVNYILPYTDKNVYVYMNNWDMSHLYKLTSDGKLVWNVTIYKSSAPVPPAIGEDGTLYVISWYLPPPLGTPYPSFMYAYSLNGTLKWKKNLGFDGPFGGLAFGKNLTMYFKGKKYLYCMTNRGEIKWKKLFYGGVTTPTFFKDTLYLSWRGNSTLNLSKLYALDLNGNIKWTFGVGTTHISSPIIDADGETIYIYFDKLYALDLSGNVKWSSNISGSIPAVGRDRLYLTKHVVGEYGTSNYLYAISKEDGEVLWKVKINEVRDTASLEATSPVIGCDGNIYVGTWYTRNDTGYLYSCLLYTSPSPRDS